MKLQPETQQGIIQIGHIFKMIRMLIINGSGSGKTNTLLNLISHQPDIDKNLSVC